MIISFTERERETDGGKVRQLVLPFKCRPQVLKELHDNMAHIGFDRTLALMRQRFYWPGIAAEIQKYISKCGLCLCRKTRRTDCAPLVSIESKYPLELVCIDFYLWNLLKVMVTSW